MHEKRRDFLCVVCGLIFTRREHLNDHTRTQHSAGPRKIFPCVFGCGKKFTWKFYARKHACYKHKAGRIPRSSSWSSPLSNLYLQSTARRHLDSTLWKLDVLCTQHTTSRIRPMSSSTQPDLHCEWDGNHLRRYLPTKLNRKIRIKLTHHLQHHNVTSLRSQRFLQYTCDPEPCTTCDV